VEVKLSAKGQGNRSKADKVFHALKELGDGGRSKLLELGGPDSSEEGGDAKEDFQEEHGAPSCSAVGMVPQKWAREERGEQRRSKRIRSNLLPALDESSVKSDYGNSSHGPSSNKASLALAVKKPKVKKQPVVKIMTALILPKPAGYEDVIAADLKFEALWKHLLGIEAAVDALIKSAKDGGLVRLVEGTQTGKGPLTAITFRHGWKFQFGNKVQHAYESEPVNQLGSGVVVTHVPLKAPPKAVEALFGRSGLRLAKNEYFTYEVLVYHLDEADDLIKFHKDYHQNEEKKLLEISGRYFELDGNGQVVDPQKLHSSLHVMTGDNEALAISCSSYTMSGPGLWGWKHARIRDKNGFEGVGVAVVRRRWTGLSDMNENVLQQWEDLYRSQAEENAAQFQSALDAVPEKTSPLEQFVQIFTSLEFKAAAFPGKYANFHNDNWVPPSFPVWFVDFGGWQRVGNGGPGTVFYNVANMHHARSLAQMLHWHEQPHEAFHHRSGVLRSGLVELGENGTILEGTKLMTTLRIFSGENATRLDKCQRVAISTYNAERHLRFEGFFKLLELGETIENESDDDEDATQYQNAIFQKVF
jgi:hypothetical protein